MKEISNKPEYLKQCESIPSIVNSTHMKIDKNFVLKYLEKYNKIRGIKDDTNDL